MLEQVCTVSQNRLRFVTLFIHSYHSAKVKTDLKKQECFKSKFSILQNANSGKQQHCTATVSLKLLWTKTSYCSLTNQDTHTYTQNAAFCPVEGWVILYWQNNVEGKVLGTVEHMLLHSGKVSRTSMNHRGIKEELNNHRVPLLLKAGWGAKSLNSCSDLEGTNIMGTNWLVG